MAGHEPEQGVYDGRTGPDATYASQGSDPSSHRFIVEVPHDPGSAHGVLSVYPEFGDDDTPACDVTVFRGSDSALVVQVDTFDPDEPIRVNLNEGTLFDGPTE